MTQCYEDAVEMARRGTPGQSFTGIAPAVEGGGDFHVFQYEVPQEGVEMQQMDRVKFPKIIGLIGRRGAGKDTVAGFIKGLGYQRLAFGDGVYLEVAAAFKVTVEFLQNRDTKETPLKRLALVHCTDLGFVERVLELAGVTKDHALAVVTQPRSPREILQLWGTEYRRQLIADDYWRTKVSTVIQANPEGFFVITDVRFKNEAMLIEQLGGSLIRVVRPAQDLEQDPALLHASETELKNYPTEAVLINREGNMDALQDATMAFLFKDNTEAMAA